MAHCEPSEPWGPPRPHPPLWIKPFGHAPGALRRARGPSLLGPRRGPSPRASRAGTMGGVLAAVGGWLHGPDRVLTADGSTEHFACRRQTELKHGRVSTSATLGYISQEIIGKLLEYQSPSVGLTSEDTASGFGAISTVPATGWRQIVGYSAFCELSWDHPRPSLSFSSPSPSSLSSSSSGRWYPSYPSVSSYPSHPHDPSYPSHPHDPSYPSYPSWGPLRPLRGLMGPSSEPPGPSWGDLERLSGCLGPI